MTSRTLISPIEMQHAFGLAKDEIDALIKKIEARDTYRYRGTCLYDIGVVCAILYEEGLRADLNPRLTISEAAALWQISPVELCRKAETWGVHMVYSPAGPRFPIEGLRRCEQTLPEGTIDRSRRRA